MELLDYTEFARSRQMDCARSLRKAELSGITRERGAFRFVFRKPDRPRSAQLAS